jgi:hypothetical protein
LKISVHLSNAYTHLYSSIFINSLLYSFKEINSLKSTLSTQKLTYDETLQQEQIRIKHEEEKKQQEIEDRLRILSSSKDELEVIFLFFIISSISST